MRGTTEAEPLILEGIDALTAQCGKEHPRTQAAIGADVELYQAWDKPDRLAELH